MIDKLKNSPLNLQANSVYNFNEFSLTELLNKFFSTINQCVDSSNQSLDFLTWLKGEGLPNEVEKELFTMYEDGRLEQSINKLSGDVLQLVNNSEIQTNQKIEEVTTSLENIDVKTTENIKSITNIDNKINTIYINAKYPPNNFNGIVGDGITDNTDYLQSMIDYLGNNGGGEIIIPNGTYLISTLKLMDRVSIIGLGRYSILKSIENNPNVAIIQLKTPRVINTKLSNFTIDGNKDKQNNVVDGVNYDNSTAVNDAHHIIEDMYIHSCNGDGFKLPTQSRENRIVNTHIEKCNRSGFSLRGTDNFISNCTSNHNVYYGFEFTNSYSNKVTSTKCFGNNKSGFYLNTSHNIQFSNIESQENGEHGLFLDGCYSFIGSSLVLDTNSVAESKKYNGIQINNSRFINIQAICSNNNLAGDGQKYAICLNGENVNSVINITGYSNTRPMYPYFEENKNITNDITVNGIKYSLNNLVDKNIYIDENKDGIADIFDEQYIHPTALTGSFLISKENSSQRMYITSSTGNGVWANVGLGKKIILSSGDVISAFSRLKISDDSILSARLIVKWYGEQDNLISESVFYDNYNLILQAEAPTDTKYCKLMIELYPKVTGGVGHVDIFSFVYGIS